MAQTWYPSTYYIYYNICNSNNKRVCLIMSSMLSLFSFRAFEKLDLDILDFWLFTELYILECFSTWFFKYALITVRTYFQTPIALWSTSCPPFQVLSFQPAGGMIDLQNMELSN